MYTALLGREMHTALCAPEAREAWEDGEHSAGETPQHPSCDSPGREARRLPRAGFHQMHGTQATLGSSHLADDDKLGELSVDLQ